MTLRKEIEEEIEPFIQCSQDVCVGCQCEIDMLTDQICSLIKSRLVYLVNSDYTSQEQYDEMVNGLIKELEGNHPQDVPFNIDEVKEFFNKGGNDVKKAREK